MPAYDFVCTSCNRPFAVRISIEEKDNVKCPHCHAGNPKQVFSSCNLIKGSSESSCNVPPGSGFS